MLQWKPKLIALIAVLVFVAIWMGQFTWDAFADQFTW
jgi:flagellar biosynthesis protein FliQ